MEMGIDIHKVKDSNFRNLVPFGFRKIGDDYLLVADTGRYVFLGPDQFRVLMEEGVTADPSLEQFLIDNCMILNPGNADYIGVDKHRQIASLAERTSLHIFVVTGRCNLACLYCQASAAGKGRSELDMTPITARKAVDLMFQTPSQQITMEFQGGEPLLNWETIQFAIEYAYEINKQARKNFTISLVSNFLLMDEEKAAYLADRRVSLCTSLDGPAVVHNKNRGKNHSLVVKNFKKATVIYKERYPYSLPGLLPTITRHSLGHCREIIDEYLAMGVCSVFIRPVNSLGYSSRTWEQIGYEPEEFEPFYRESIDYMLELNRKGTYVRETQSGFMLSKILDRTGYRYVDLSSPCGAARGQIAYNYDGGIYPCDEARMIAKSGDDSFRLGNVGECSYHDIMLHPTCRALAAASTLDSLPGCSLCVYRPYCGVCPICHYADTGDIFTNIYQDRRHKILEMMFDILFEKLRDPENEKIFRSWLQPI